MTKRAPVVETASLQLSRGVTLSPQRGGPFRGPLGQRLGAHATIVEFDEVVEWVEPVLTDSSGSQTVTVCNRPTTLGNADNVGYDNRSQQPRSLSENSGTSDVQNARLNWHFYTGGRPLVEDTDEDPDLPGSRHGTGPSPCVVCGCGVQVNAALCVQCAYLVPLGRRHFPYRVLYRGGDDGDE